MGKPKQGIPELVAPAGDMEKLKTAIHFGADAVYLSGKEFSLRSFSKNFTLPEMDEAVRFVHSQDKRIYLAANSFLRNRDLDLFRSFAQAVAPIGFDAVIISDPAALQICRECLPATALHLSTQVNTLNAMSARHWFAQGFSRIILARELSLEELNIIKRDAPGEIEIFVHGAMCMAYSGRCLLSLYLADREANQGSCTHTCRWSYALMEETRPGEYFPIEQDDQGTYILNSKDLCLLEFLPQLVENGLDALKIEGRMKGIHYLAGVIKAYRWALDRFIEDPDNYRLPDECREELNKLNHRDYTTGFARGEHEDTICSASNTPVSPYLMAGIIEDRRSDGWHRVGVRGRIKEGDSLEKVGRTFPNPVLTIEAMKTLDGKGCHEAHPGTEVLIQLPSEAVPGDILRISVEE